MLRWLADILVAVFGTLLRAAIVIGLVIIVGFLLRWAWRAWVNPTGRPLTPSGAVRALWAAFDRATDPGSVTGTGSGAACAAPLPPSGRVASDRVWVNVVRKNWRNNPPHENVTLIVRNMTECGGERNISGRTGELIPADLKPNCKYEFEAYLDSDTRITTNRFPYFYKHEYSSSGFLRLPDLVIPIDYP